MVRDVVYLIYLYEIGHVRGKIHCVSNLYYYCRYTVSAICLLERILYYSALQIWQYQTNLLSILVIYVMYSLVYDTDMFLNNLIFDPRY